MRSRYKIIDSDGIYFLTATIVEWIPVFTSHEACNIIIDTLRFCQSHKNLRLFAYVIMDSHIHLLAEAPELGRVMQSFKSYTAKEILAAAERTGRSWLLNQFEFLKKQHKQTGSHQVWQEGTHPQLMQNETMLHQKIEYIHANPVRRGYVDVPEHWRYSSARNYFFEDHSLLCVDTFPLGE